MNKHEATEKAIRIADINEEVKRLEAEHGIDKLNKELKKLRAEIDEFTGKQTTSLLGGVEVVYTTTHNFSKELFANVHPEINLDDEQFKAECTRFKEIKRA